MNEIECKETYNALAAILKNNSLEWVTVQVEEQINIGKTVSREIETLKEQEDQSKTVFIEEVPVRQFRKGPKDFFPVSLPYSASESLEILINAIENTIVDTASMEIEVLGYFQTTQDMQRILFYSDEPGGEPKILENNTSKSRLESSNKIKSFLDALRKEVVS